MKLIAGLKIFKGTTFNDERGYYWTSWKKNKNLKLHFNHDKFSISKKNTLRGLHGDYKTWKLISCVYGKIFFVVVNYKIESKQFLKYSSFLLDHKKNQQILVPPDFLNGMLCLSDFCVLHYKLSYSGKYLDANNQISIKWNDRRLKIKWPINKNLIISKRDQ
jgi:dTDP-4-dehydrorhamnose 3,5-epimerase